MKNSFKKSFIILNIFFVSISLPSCGGGGSGDSTIEDPDNPTIISGPAPKLSWSVDSDTKNPATDLGRCSNSVMACVESGTALQDCFAEQVPICQDSEPSGDCCMQACGDQLAQLFDSGVSEDEAFLEVFVYDGSCMPGISKNGTAP